MAKKAKKDADDADEGKKGLPRSFIFALIGLVVMPLTIFIGWYVLTVVLEVSGSKQTAEGMVAQSVLDAKQAVKRQLEERAKKEGFSIDNVEGCSKIQDQYKVPLGFVFTEFSKRQLVGLPKTSTDDQVQERCILFAKVVERMESLAHHDRHVFVCQGSQFTTDEAGRYMLLPDAKGRGVIEVVGGAKKLIKIPRHSHTLLKQWQIYNIGDGCMVVGMSKVGVFNFSGSVKIQQ